MPGIDSIYWRYDPIFINDEFDVQRHISEFERLCKMLSGYTKSCTISFLDLYEKVKRNAPDLRPPTKDEEIQMVKEFIKIGKRYGIEINACLEKVYLKEFGISVDGCMSQAVVEKSIGAKLNPVRKNSVRSGCNCLLGNDIGVYNTCGHMCRYCYANENKLLVRENMKRHNPDSPFLIGDVMRDDEIIDAKQVSWIDIDDGQESLF